VPIIAITVFVMLTILSHNVADSLLQGFVVVLCRQRQDIPPMAEQLVTNTSVDLQALWYSHTEPCQHHWHVVEVVAWQQLVLVEVLSGAASHRPFVSLKPLLALGDFVHELLEDE
jgi:hypothetical protein